MTPPPPGQGTSGRPARTVFLGSGAFAVEIVRMLAGHPAVTLVGVVAPPDRPVGRRAEPTAVPVAAEARRLGVPLLQPERFRSAEAVAAIEGLAADLGVLADFGRIVPPAILALPAHGILNVHPSLLPRHRGAAPIPATILDGDTVAGVSVIRMDAGLDTGPVVATRSWPLTGRESAPELETRAAQEGAGLVAGLLAPYLAGSCRPVAQDDAAATLTRPLRRADGWLDPGRPTVHLERQVRAFLPWPGSYVETAIGRLAVLRAEVVDRLAGDRTGELAPHGDGLALVTPDGRLRLTEVQLAGRRPMSGPAFLRGHPAAVERLVSAPP